MKSKLKYINTLEQKINYNFNNKDLLEEALTHSSFKNKSNSNQERLEFLGDRVLGLVISQKLLEKYPEEFRNEDYRVIGCASQVWFYPEIVEINGQKIFSFKGDSDAMIVRGLIKILTTIYNDTEIKEASNIDPYKKLELLNLKEHISSQRSNGLNSIILKIKEFLLTNLRLIEMD